MTTRSSPKRSPSSYKPTAFFHKPLDHDGLINVIRRTLGEISTSPTPGFDTTFTN